MSMTARERILACINGEEPDKIPVFAYDWLRTGSPGGWVRRLVKRGLLVVRFICPYEPAFLYPWRIDPHLEDVIFIERHYVEKGISKIRHTYETPVGNLTGVIQMNPGGQVLAATREHLVKETADRRVINYIFKRMTEELKPSYEQFERNEDELGEVGITYAYVDKTPYQRAWVELAMPEKAVVDFHEKPAEIEEYIEIQRQFHTRAAEIVAESPATIVDLADHATDMTPPYYYRDYCIPFYEIYEKTLAGTGKIFATHLDGRLGHLKHLIAKSPVKIIESMAYPPTGDLSLTEVKSIWPDKKIFLCCPNHLALLDYEDVKKGYEAIVEEWGSKKNLMIGHSEEMPVEKVEMHLTALMDVLGYE